MAMKKAATNAKPRVRKAKAASAHTSIASLVEDVPAPAHLATPALEVALDPQPVAEAAPQTRGAVIKKGNTARYLLPSNMEIPALGPVHADLVALEAGNDGPFVLDGANLNVIDTAGLQLLISFVSAVQASGRKLSWDNYSVQAYQLASELGVVEQLGD